jgi:hypothetical protein
MSDIMYYHCFHVTESSLLGKYHSEMLGIVTGTRFGTRWLSELSNDIYYFCGAGTRFGTRLLIT